jgi:hypothetical protein
MTNDEIIREIERLSREVNILKGSNMASMGPQTIMSGDITMLGQTAIRFPIIYALSSGSNPTDSDANGVFLNAFGETFDGSTLYQLGGVNNGGLMFGLRSTDGSALFMGGQGIIDNTGINTRGIGYGLRQYAEDPTDSTTKRYFRLEMLLPDGRTQPAGSLTFMSGDETNLITNGDAETGDLSNWTQSGTLWSADSSEYHGGAYSFKFDNNLSTAETLTSDRYAASASKIYSISAWMKDYYDSVDVSLRWNGGGVNPDPKIATLQSLQPTLNRSSVVPYIGWTGANKEHVLLKWDYSGIPQNIYAVSSSKILTINPSVSGAQTYKFYRVLRDWVYDEATWNVYSTGNNWGTAGAENTTSDRDSVEMASVSTSGSTPVDATLSNTITKQLIDGTYTNYGVVGKGVTETGATARYGGIYDTDTVMPRQDITYIEASKYTVYIKFYDHASAGNLIRTDTLFIENNTASWNERTSTVTAPAGALSYAIVISGGKGREFWIDDIVVAEQTFANKLLFLPELSYQDSDSTRRILSAKKELYAPLAPVIALDTVVYQPDDTTGVDTFLNSGAATTNYETNVQLNIGESNSSTNVLRSLIKFPFSNLPTGTQIDSATLDLVVAADYSSNARALNAHRMLTDWVESQATWNIRKTGTNWATAGGNLTTEVEAASSGSVNCSATEAVGTVKSLSLDAAKTQEMLDGTLTNNGWMLRMATETDDAYGFDSSSSATASERPKMTLVIDDAWKCTNGAHKVKVTFVDADGETEAGAESNSVTVSAANPFIDVTLEVGPWGTTARNIYMTEAGGTVFKFAKTINDNSTLTYKLNVPDASLTTVAPVVNLSGSRPLSNRIISVPGAGASSNATLTYANAERSVISTTAANANNGDWFKWSFVADKGTYTIRIYGYKNTTSGILDWYIDNAPISTGQDWYAASAAFGSFALTNIVIAESGYHIIKAVVNSKHASSSDYTAEINEIIFIRTEL